MAKYIMTCKLNFYQSKKAGKIAVVTMDNGQSYNVPNTWGFEAFESLNKVLDIVESDPDVKGWLLVGKPFIFNVGADIMSVTPMSGRRGADRQDGPQILQADHGPENPTLAAIKANRRRVEVGLYHTISKSPGGCDHYAPGETFLGLVPGWGGPARHRLDTEVAIRSSSPNPLNRTPRSLKEGLQMGLADGSSRRPSSWTTLKLLGSIITGEEDRAQGSTRG